MTIALLIAGGLVALYFGAEWLVRGAASLALRLGMTPLVAGLTVVAFGTSSPELVVSVASALKGEHALAIGNAVGSNIFNIAFILGLTSLITPIRVQSQIVKIDIPVMVGVAVLFLVFFRDSQIGFAESVLLMTGIVIYTGMQVVMARRQGAAEPVEEFEGGVPRVGRSLWLDLALISAGLAVLILGSRLFVSGAVDLARMLGMSEAVIGLTIVAGGTSLPELAASIVAALRRQPDIAVGNIVGSNIYNILAILGAAGLAAGPLVASSVSAVDTWVMLGFCVVLLPVALSGRMIHRWEGGVLLLAYGGYLAWHWPT